MSCSRSSGRAMTLISRQILPASSTMHTEVSLTEMSKIRIALRAALLPLMPEAAPNETRCTISLQCSTSPGIEDSGGRPNTPTI